MITLTINGKKVKAKENTTLLEICQKMSVSIPTLCHHPDLTPQGSCRLCTVEVSQKGKSQMVTACNYPVREGIRVETHSERTLQVRRILIELLLARCPQVPFVQNLARELGVRKSPYKSEKPENNCILCGLCVRTCEQIVGAHALGFSRRGTQKKIGTPFEIDSERCVACGACEYICPTGAVKMETDRIRKLRQSDTGIKRYCRYMRLGLIDFMICSNGFECWRCDVDQKMEDRFGTHPAFALKPGKGTQSFQVNGFTFYPKLYYSPAHIWAKPMEELIRLGLDDLASHFAMEAEMIRLPSVGSLLKKKEGLAEIRVEGKIANLLSPLTGTVVAVNRDVEEAPDLAWRDPYQRGWLLMIKPDHLENISQLYSGDLAKQWFTEEAQNLASLFMKWTPPSSKKEPTPDRQLIQKMILKHWDQLAEALLKNNDKLEARNPKFETITNDRNRKLKTKNTKPGKA